MLALIAVGFAVFVGVVGLGVDIGFVTMNQHVLKNSGDAAAIAGAIKLVENEAQIQPDVTALLLKHTVPAGTTSACDIVDGNGAVVQSGCAAGAPSTAAGVRVSLDYSRPTFFMALLGSPTMFNRTKSLARAFVESSYNANASLFAVCGWNTKLESGGTMPLLQGTAPGASPWPVNPAAIGQTFIIHGPQVETCGMNATSFKGLTDPSTLLTLPHDIPVNGGTQAGPTRVTVSGNDGCAVGVQANDCVMLIPVTTLWSTGGGNNLPAVRWLPFRVFQVSSNKHTGVLLGTSYVVSHDPNAGTGSTWSKGGTNSGPLSVRLAE